ncbi:methylaspartate mutase [Actinokineospora bangkokensis]|uniref:Methylaspartate mutase n=1 Tax=Actinokineospora bangkokensis TaxID=1193682 RepID=A0A1Q9LNV0_9PSEU|nr:methylaspartate mutase [Actinokineospora bangkokensis]OLR93679.1 methylaspartate mutase [Actinokineospora bangkokensis]
MTPGFGAAVRAAGELVVQPRMGFADPRAMRAGLLATRGARATTVGTITVDSYTRVGDLAAARLAAERGTPLNGYPIATADPVATAEMLAAAAFPVQVRHGSALPAPVFDAMARLGLAATEGGPVSYCLPYSRVPLSRAVPGWAECVRRLAGSAEDAHLETFGGCMLGQLCPPGLLVALSVLEALFFRSHGVRDVSLSLTQQTNREQDLEALHALRALAARFLPDTSWHVVLYAYMGVYPRTPSGARALLADAAELAVRGGAARLIVKTEAEAHRIPTTAENVAALELAAAAARAATPDPLPPPDTGLLAEATALVEAVLDLDADLGRALVRAFAAGVLDVPFCLHADNAGRARSHVDDDGWLRWSSVGSMPLDRGRAHRAPALSSSGLLAALSRVQRRYDEEESRVLGDRPSPAALGPA